MDDIYYRYHDHKYRGALVPTHSSSTCFMRTDTLQASLVTSLHKRQGKAKAQQEKIK